MLFVTLILLIICVVNATPVSLAGALDQAPSPETILQWYDPLKGRDSIVVAGMKITANVPSVNLDNIQSLLSIKCNQDRVTMVLTEPLPSTNWKVQKTLLVIGSQHEKAGVTGSFEILALPGVESSQGGGITTDDISNGQASTHLLQKRGRVSKPKRQNCWYRTQLGSESQSISRT
ncbi:hypothetical protein RTP6_004933 [Batrachochytrium dendrobatidis]